ncbi:hypothetical protein WUBG_10571, partial [Wuchereria bancrofti]
FVTFHYFSFGYQSYFPSFFIFKEKNGGRIIEISSISSDEKFEIAKPEIDDTEKLRDMINESNEQIDLKKITIDTLKQTNMKLNKQLTVCNNFLFFFLCFI